jgi:chemotaxis protein MotA
MIAPRLVIRDRRRPPEPWRYVNTWSIVKIWSRIRLPNRCVSSNLALARQMPVVLPEITLSSSAVALKEIPRAARPRLRNLDVSMFAGIAIATMAAIAGIAATGIRLSYFFQPTGLLIVFGGTVGVIFITTPRTALVNAWHRAMDLLWMPDVDRVKLIEEIMTFVKPARGNGLIGVQTLIERARHPFLKESLLLALDVQQRSELQTTLETKIRLRERQGETDAKVLEVAGGFAPTIGVLGTVVGLIDVLRQFSNLSSVAGGIGTAFVSTIYGLALANLLLLPIANRIRVRVAETFEIQEMISEAVLCMHDRMHPSLVRERLQAFLREAREQ